MNNYKNDIKYPLGGSAITIELYNWIRTNIPVNSTILELGSGYGSTGNLQLFYKMYSVEDNPSFINKFNSTYLHAPLVDGWYNKNLVCNFIKSINYDVILIDGPVGTKNRSNFYLNKECFDLNCTIIIDDTHRDLEYQMSKRLSEDLNRELLEYNNKTHGFCIILK